MRHDRTFVLKSAQLEAKLLNYGATLMALRVPQAGGGVADVVLGFQDPARYHEPHPHYGGTVGRYANRIALGRFTLDGAVYQLASNEGPHHLHGGARGFDRVPWSAEQAGNALLLRYESAHGEEGYPGALEARVTYSLEGGALRIAYEARTDRPTIVNLTNHAYFNLAGGGTIDDHELRVAARRYVETDRELIPTGQLAAVDGTAMDFTSWRRIGAAEIDHTFVLEGPVELRAPQSGLALRIRTTQPGVQVYTGHLSGRAGICLEPQHFPDSPNQPGFPSTVLRPGETYRHHSLYEFTHG